MVWIILIGLLIMLLGWLLIAPLGIYIDTTTGAYYFQWTGIARVRVIPLPNDIKLRLEIFFWKKEWYPLHPGKQPDKKVEKATKQKKKTRRSTFKKGTILKILRSFRVRIFQLDLDTDNYILNSYLYPILYFLSNKKRYLRINYEGRAELKLHIVNQPYRILKAILF